ncbi:hypothetical protein Q5O_17840 [Pseudomonas putida JB]|uniref:Uncharacterized protein n=1 Tax=Pseudomonas putida S12 TaxID=1215087 RepID=A0AA34RX65_PSEPU|nr:hypothetical protein RPPX_18190 [Pseudomonas putida S12]AOX10176.1 hypothetical protein Q5O_17840 [Pseudomonas putida JB]PWY45107.1 hypothetical protein DK184_10645 [Pseudomonas sp. RW405]TFF50760.1 hypothetical protein C5609_16850 [Pseudomonas putida]TFW33395.1 hypothetical protein E4195_25830 [Pseudomonas putida]
MEAIITSESARGGIDLGNHSCHLHGQDTLGQAVYRKKLDSTISHTAQIRIPSAGALSWRSKFLIGQACILLLRSVS